MLFSQILKILIPNDSFSCQSNTTLDVMGDSSQYASVNVSPMERWYQIFKFNLKSFRQVRDICFNFTS